jgi:hypothetical protein
LRDLVKTLSEEIAYPNTAQEFMKKNKEKKYSWKSDDPYYFYGNYILNNMFQVIQKDI